MNSQKRHKLKKRMINFFRIGWIGGISFLTIGIILRLINDTNELWYGLLCSALLVGGIIISLAFHFIGTYLSLNLRRDKSKIYYKRYRLHLCRFYDLINNKELDKAVDMFDKFISVNATKNIDNLSSHLAQGILIGVIKENYDIVSESTKKSVEKRLKLITNMD